jgi:hypothetical protein
LIVAGGIDIIGLILGIQTALTFAYLITQVIVRLTAEPERPELFPFGDIVNLPEEVRSGRKGLGGNGHEKANPTGTRNNVIARHGRGK